MSYTFRRPPDVRIPDAMPVPLMGAPNVVQSAFRIRSGDTISLNVDSGWLAAVNVSGSRNSHTRFRIRFEIEENNGIAFAETLDCRVSIDGGAYIDYGELNQSWGSWSSTPAVWFADTSVYNDGDATTDLLTGAGTSGETFTAGEGQGDNTTGVITLNQQHTEIEFPIILPKLYDGPAHHDAGTTFDFRLYQTDGTPLDGYTNTPRITLTHETGKIGGTEMSRPDHVGPFVDSNDNMYFMVANSPTSEKPVMMKSTDDGVTWLPVDVAGSPFATIYGYSIIQDGSILRMLIHRGSNVRYSEFYTSDDGTAPDEWGTGGNLNQLVESDSFPSYAETVCLVKVSSTEFWGFWTLSIPTSELRYAKRTSGTWGTINDVDTSIGVISSATAVVDSNNDTYIFYQDYAAEDLYYKLLTSGGTLDGSGTIVATDISFVGSNEFGIVPGLLYDDGGVDVIVIGWMASSNVWTRYLRDGVLQTASRADNEIVFFDNISDKMPMACLANNGKDVYFIYSDLFDNDVYRNLNSDEAGWGGTDIELHNNVYAWRPRASFIDHSSDTVIGYVWNNSRGYGTVFEDGPRGPGGVIYDGFSVTVAPVGRRVFITHV